jgi:hypothetical protein
MTTTTGFDILLISFRGVTLKHLTSIEELGDCIRSNNKHGINYIKRFDPSKDAFKSISKADLKNIISYNTDAIIQLQNLNFIKK